MIFHTLEINFNISCFEIAVVSCFEAAHLAGFGPKKTSMACLPGRKKSRGAAGGDFPMEQQLEHLFPELLRKVWDHLGSNRQVIAAITPVSKALRDVPVDTRGRRCVRGFWIS